MFLLTEPTSGDIQHIVLVHSVSAHIMGDPKHKCENNIKMCELDLSA
jgi:hypothetical protein